MLTGFELGHSFKTFEKLIMQKLIKFSKCFPQNIN